MLPASQTTTTCCRSVLSSAKLAFQLRRAAWVAIALLGLALSWNAGQLPQRDLTPITNSGDDTLHPSSLLPHPSPIAPDLDLYLEVIARVRGGESYYAVAAEAIPSHGFPTSSPLNWRLPTYAWLLSRLSCPAAIQLFLVGLSIIALVLTFKARALNEGLPCAAATALVLVGVVRWSLDGYACVAQEPWAATLIAISLAAHSLGGRMPGWRMVAVLTGLSALFFRELALPFCGLAALVSLANRRWVEAASWTTGIAAFCGFYAWHVTQIKAQLAFTDATPGTGLSQWLRLGGLDFVLLSTRMNGLLFNAPGPVIWLFLLAALLGFATTSRNINPLAGLATAGYLVAFAFLGRPENFYWGLIPAPMLAWGIGSLTQAAASQRTENRDQRPEMR